MDLWSNVIIIMLIINSILVFGKKNNLLACGLIGFSAKEGKSSDTTKLTMLMLANMKRGVHSSGMYYGGDILKDAEIADIFLSKNKIKKSPIFIGHVRQASVGAKTKANAHPFLRDNIVGVHNGTLKEWIKTANLINVSHADVYVDSDFLIKALAEDFNDKKYEVLRMFNGAAALIWSSKADLTTMYVYRNYDRPLFHGSTKHGLYLSSTEESLSLIGAEDIASFQPGKVFTITNGIILEESISIEKIYNTSTKHLNNHNSQPYTNAYNDKRTYNHHKDGGCYLSKDNTYYKKGVVLTLELYREPPLHSKFIVSTEDRIDSYTYKFDEDKLIRLGSVIKGSYAVSKKAIDIYSNTTDKFIRTIDNGEVFFVDEIEFNEMHPLESYAECRSYNDGSNFDIPLHYLAGIPFNKVIDSLDCLGHGANQLTFNFNKLSQKSLSDKNDDEINNDDESAKKESDKTRAEIKAKFVDELSDLSVNMANSLSVLTDSVINDEIVFSIKNKEDILVDYTAEFVDKVKDLIEMIQEGVVKTLNEFKDE